MSPVESAPRSGSTGPRTPEGKSVSSHNALRHGLTGRVVVLPTEDMNVYRAFCEELMADLAPETPLERQYAQTFCDTQWRLNRARSYEDSMLALGHFEGASIPGIDSPEIDAALTAAKVFRDNSKAFVNLSLYELQTKRRAAEKTELEAARKLHEVKAQPSEPASDNGSSQFVFSTADIERELSRPGPRPEAKTARSPHPDRGEQAA